MSSLPSCPYAYPADDDLDGVVTRLTELTTRRGPAPRDPNEPEVRWLLEAGLRALGEAVLERSTNGTGPLAYTNANGLFDALPLERVMSAFRIMCREQGIDPGSANKARLIRRWSFAANYQLDLVAYLFRPASHTHRLSHVMNDLYEVLPHVSLGDLVDRAIEHESSFAPMSTMYRLQHVLRLMFPHDEDIRQYSAGVYDVQMAHWSRTISVLASAFDLPIQNDDDVFDDLASILGLILEGTFVRGYDMPRHVHCVDGTPAVVAAVRSVVAAATGMPWTEIADRRASLDRVAMPV